LNFRFTLAMVAVLVVLGGVVWYTELRNGPAPAPTPNGQATVLDLNSADVTKFEVDAGSAKAVVERGSDNVWRLTAPQPGEADNTTVDSTVSRLAKLNATRKLDSPGNLGDYGLASPTTKLMLTTKDGNTSELDLGAKTPDSSSYYVKLPSQDAVYVVSSFAIGDVTTWPTTPPKPKPTATPLPSTPPTPGSPVPIAATPSATAG